MHENVARSLAEPQSLSKRPQEFSSKARMRAETQQKLQQTACLGVVRAAITLT